MPTPRFFKLPAAKRQRILDAAMAELARVPFEEMSINRIIAEADISRGSFYQYFTDKRDLLEHLMAGYQHTMMEKARQALEESGGDIFHTMRSLLDFTIEYGTAPENYAFCRNVFLSIPPEGDYCFDFARFDVDVLLNGLGTAVDFSGFRSTRKEDLLVFVDILVTLLRTATARLFADAGRAGEVRDMFAKELDVVRCGILQGEVARVG